MKNQIAVGLPAILALSVQERITLARCAAFLDILRLTVDEEKRLGKEAQFTAKGKASKSGGKGNGVDPMRLLQDATVSRSNVYADAFGVSFPDETERETISLDVLDAIETEGESPEDCEPSDADIREVFENVED